MAAICVDAGTSLIKTVAFDEDGKEIAAAHQRTEVLRPRPGWSEQNMEGVWNAVVLTIRSVAEQIRQKIDFIALTAQGDGCWLVDQGGTPTGSAVLWNDGRAWEVIEGWEQSGVIERAYQINGSRHFAGLPHAILTWLRKNEPSRLRGAHKALYCGGWIFWNLTGQFAVDQSDASAPFLEIRERAYSTELLRLYEMEWAEPFLPEVLGNGQRVGRLSQKAAAELSMAADVLVILSSYDVASTALGSGVVAPGQACCVLGTTLCTEVVKDSVETSGAPAGLCLSYNVAGTYLRAFPTLAGTEVFRWMQELMHVDHPRDFGRLASHVPPGAGNLIFLPYLSAAGERNPFYNPSARGTFFGLSFEHDRAHVAKAILEGLSFVIQECLQHAAAEPTGLRLCGGAAKDEEWCQIIADITNLPVQCTNDSEVGAKGAFIQGTVSLGIENDFRSAAQKYVQVRRTFEPDPSRALAYQELYRRFLDVRDIAQQAWSRMKTAPR